jgi:hypothetical protein
VIAALGDAVACLGGWRGDRLFVATRGGALTPVTELGWDAHAQATPQRRLLLVPGQILVLEPVAGALLLPPLRVRRLDLLGNEISREEGEGVRGPAHLYFHARRAGRGRTHVTRCGIDAATGKPTVEEEEIAADLPRTRAECSGTPLLARGEAYYPVRGRGLFRGAELCFRGDPASPQLVGDRVICAGNRGRRPGLYVDGRWHALPGPRLFPHWRAPLGPFVAPAGQGLAVLRRGGGPLPVLDAPPLRLPPGSYSGLLEWNGRLLALADGETPSLVPPDPPDTAF